MNIKVKYQDCRQLGKLLYTCKIISASIKEPNQEVKFFIGKHVAGKRNHDVEGIWFLNTEVYYMPKGISKIFPNLKTFEISGCGLKEIARQDLIGLENLSGLFLIYNELTTLPDDLFEGMEKLKLINFSNNKLELVSSQLLQPVLGNQLTYVGFLNNPTINAAFNGSVENPCGKFVDLPGLMKLIDEKCKKPPLDDFNSNIIKGFKDFWTSGILSDFTIIIGDQKFKVHKTVLTLQSGFFKKMFVNQVESVAELINEDFSAEAVAEAVEGVLRWMYTGQVPGNHPVKVLSLCVKLEISALKLIAENSVIKKLNQENAMELLVLGHRFDTQKLIKAAFEEVKKILDEPDLDEELMKEPEELKKIIDAKKNYEKMLENRKKRKLN